jgi:uncharacterized membrane protein
MRSPSGASVALSSRSIVTAVVSAGLFLAGVALAMAFGPPLAPQDAGGPSLAVGDFYVGWTVGLTLVIVWTVARLRPSDPPGFIASLALVAAIFYVGLTGTYYLAAVVHSATTSHADLPGAESGAWFVLSLIIGLVVAVLASLLGGLILNRTGRLDGRAVGFGMLLGASAVVIGYNLYIQLYDAAVYVH